MSEFRRILRHHLNQTRAGLFGQFEHAFNFNTGPDQNAALKIGPQQSITFSGILDDGSDTPFSLKVTNDLTGPSGEGFQCQTQDPQSGTIVVGADPQKGQATLEFDAGAGEPPSPPQTSTLLYATQGLVDKWEAISLDWSTDPRIFSKTPPLVNGVAREVARSFAGNYFGIDVAGTAGNPVHTTSYDSNANFRWSFSGAVSETGRAIQHDALNDVALIAASSSASDTRLVGVDDAAAALSGSGNTAQLWSTKLAGGNRRVMDMKVNNNGHVYVLLQFPTTSYEGGGAAKNLFKINTLNGDIEASYNTATTGGGGSDGGRIAIGPSGEVVVTSNDPTTPEGGSGDADIVKLDADLNLVAQRKIDWVSKIGFSIDRPVAIDSLGEIYASHGLVFAFFGGPPLTILKFSSDLSLELYDVTIGSADANCAEMVVLNDELFLGGVSDRGGTAVIFRVVLATGVLSDTFFPPLQKFLATVNGVEGVNIFVASEGNKANLFTQEPSTNPPGRIPCIAAVKYDAGNIVSVYFNSVDLAFKEEEFTAEHSAEGVFDISSAPPGWEYNTPL